MVKYTKKIRVLLLFGMLLVFRADGLHTRASASESTEAPGAADAVPEQAAEVPENTDAPTSETGEQMGDSPESVPEEDAPPSGSSVPAATSTVSRKKGTTSSSEQVKKDIEASLDEHVREAVINGYLSLLNKEYILRDELELELVGIGNGHELEKRSADAITKMVLDAKREKMYINITSSYRTYKKQVDLFKRKIQRLESAGYSHEEAVRRAGRVVAVPGTSEHQLGLTVDFVTGSYKVLDEGIRGTKEYKWIEAHAWEYGYVIRYPFGKSEVTGIISEPWHLRYVGIPAAKLMSEQGICLEEFLGVAYDGQRDGLSYGAGWVNTGR